MNNILEDKCCALVVLGGGGSGLVAAVRAAQLTGEKVIVVEKLSKPGGGAQFASCSRVFDSKWQRERGLESHTADYIRHAQDDMYWRLDPELVANCIRGTGAFFDWFLELAPELENEFVPGTYLFPTKSGAQFEPVGPQMGHEAKKMFGKAVVDVLVEQCRKMDIEVLTSCAAIDLEMDQERVSAVLVRSPNGIIRIRCRACVLATGSWIRNREIMERICPALLNMQLEMTPHLSHAYTGDGIALAEKAGAFIDYDSFCLRMMGPLVMLHSPLFRAMIQSKYTICVNMDGKRYCSEPISHMETFEDGVVQLAQPQGVCWFLFDTHCIEAHSQLPYQKPKYEMMEMFALPPFPTDWEEICRQINDAFLSGERNIFRANTLEELALLTGIDAQGLQDTVERYNGFCRNGMDWDFVKPADALVALDQGPFYAVRATPGTDGAFGGVQVDSRMRARNADRTGIVEGLYVTGDFASGRHVNIAGVKRQILNDMSWAFSSGFLAGTAVADYLKE